MSTPFDTFSSAVERLSPRALVVLGSGLGEVASTFDRLATVSFGDVPGFAASGVVGHKGLLAVGTWNGVPAIVSFGRVHFYEAHPWDRVTRVVRLAAESGVRLAVFTNAAGGIHPSLRPGELMAIRGHLKLLDHDGWRRWAEDARDASPYSSSLVTRLREIESAAGRDLQSGVYAALTGPSYETPAEIRALRTIGADAVGMSTAIEAETAAELGMDVVGISTITNAAAGLSDQPLHHAEVERTARLVTARLGELLSRLLSDG